MKPILCISYIYPLSLIGVPFLTNALIPALMFLDTLSLISPFLPENINEAVVD